MTPDKREALLAGWRETLARIGDAPRSVRRAAKVTAVAALAPAGASLTEIARRLIELQAAKFVDASTS